MTSQYWQNVANRLPGFLMQTSALALTAEYMTRPHCGHGFGIFGYGFANPTFMMPTMTYMPTYTMPYYQQPMMPFSQLYPQTYSPAYTPTYPQQTYTPTYPQNPQTADAVNNSYSQNIGYNFIMGEDTNFVSSKWKNLDQKSGKTSAEEIELKNKYTGFIENLSKSFIATLDNNKAGNKDGYLNKQEFQSYFVGQHITENTTNEEIEQLKTDSDKIFDMLDLAKDNKLDWKEIGAYLSMADSAIDGKYDGNITKDEKKAILEEMKQGTQGTQGFLRESYLNLYT